MPLPAHMQLPASNRINFGLTGDSFIIGYLTNETLHSGHPKLMQLITGAGWLVRQYVKFAGILVFKSGPGLHSEFLLEEATTSCSQIASSRGVRELSSGKCLGTRIYSSQNNITMYLGQKF